RNELRASLVEALEAAGISNPASAVVAQNVDDYIRLAREQCTPNKDSYVSNEISSGTNWDTGETVGPVTAKAFQEIFDQNGGTQTVLASEGTLNEDRSSTIRYFDPANTQLWDHRLIEMAPDGGQIGDVRDYGNVFDHYLAFHDFPATQLSQFDCTSRLGFSSEAEGAWFDYLGWNCGT